MRLLIPAATAVLLTVAAAISFARGAEMKSGDLTVTSAAVSASPFASVAAAYLTIENAGDADDRLVKAESPAAKSVGAHETKVDQGVAMMRPIDNLVIPAHGRIEMQPGGIHLMMSGLSQRLKGGDSVTIRLVFDKAGEIDVPVKVGPLAQDTPMHMDMKPGDPM